MADTKEYITTSTLIKQVGNITQVTDDATHITPFMPLGRLAITKIIGKEKYDLYKVKEDTDEDKEILARAESYLCLVYIMPHLNNVSAGAGIVKSTGFNESRVDMLSASDIETMIDRYLATANELLTDYKLPQTTSECDTPDAVTAGRFKMIKV